MNPDESVRVLFRPTLMKKSFFFHILLSLGVLSFYLLSTSWLLPVGVNKAFVTRFAYFLIPVTVILFLAYFLIVFIRRNNQQLLNSPEEKLSPRLLILLLLPLTPVVQYILNNTEILSWFESVLVFCLFVLFVSLPVIVIPFLLRKTGSIRLLMSLGLAFAFTITNMASLSKQFAWHEVGSVMVQLAVFAIVWLISALTFHLNLQNIMYLLVVAFFITNSMIQLSAQNENRSDLLVDEKNNMLVSWIGDKKPSSTPNIYLLVYDAYVVSETMAMYGIDNRAQEQYLEDQGFKIYPHTYSVGSYSIHSMSLVLNASTSFYGDQRRGVSGDGVVQNLLKRYGYKTFGIFPIDHFFRGTIPSYDYSFPSHGSSVNLLTEAILIGEFRFDLNFDEVPREQYILEKNKIFSEDSRSPRFIYTHSTLPGHSQNSGVCLPNEIELFSDRLDQANLEMRDDIKLIMENDPDAIVIVAGDHGPYLTKNCYVTKDAYPSSEISRLDIQDRYGSFLAIKWPSSDFEEYDEITVLQDLFPAIFAYLFSEPGLLNAKVETVIHNSDIYVSGVLVVNGVIKGGIDDGEALFTEKIER